MERLHSIEEKREMTTYHEVIRNLLIEEEKRLKMVE